MIIPDPLLTLAEQFELLRLRFTVQLLKGGRLPAFKGSMLHGWLGHALKEQDAPLYHLLYDQHANQQPKPYFINIKDDKRQHWHQDEMLSFEITLLGSACSFGVRLVTALQAASQLGLGQQNLPFALQSVASVLPNRLKPGLHTSKLSDWLQPSEISLHSELALQLQTPLRLKDKGKIIQQGIPSLPLLLQQINRRLTLLSTFWVNDNPVLLADLNVSLPNLGDHSAHNSKVFFENWQRYSVRQNEFLPFGGLTGQLCYQGDIMPAISWLQVGEQLQLGGKTTFGLGQFELIY